MCVCVCCCIVGIKWSASNIHTISKVETHRLHKCCFLYMSHRCRYISEAIINRENFWPNPLFQEFSGVFGRYTHVPPKTSAVCWCSIFSCSHYNFGMVCIRMDDGIFCVKAIRIPIPHYPHTPHLPLVHCMGQWFYKLFWLKRVSLLYVRNVLYGFFPISSTATLSFHVFSSFAARFSSILISKTWFYKMEGTMFARRFVKYHAESE